MEETTTPAEAVNPATTQAPAATGATVTPPTTEAKSFTQADIDRIVTERLDRANAKRETEAAEAKRLADLSAEERVKELERKYTELETTNAAKLLEAQRKAALAGKVSNVDRVLALADAATHFDGGNPKLDAILKDFPEYAVKSTSSEVPGANGSAGLAPDLEKALQSGDAAAINAALDAALKAGR